MSKSPGCWSQQFAGVVQEQIPPIMPVHYMWRQFRHLHQGDIKGFKFGYDEVITSLFDKDTSLVLAGIKKHYYNAMLEMDTKVIQNGTKKPSYHVE